MDGQSTKSLQTFQNLKNTEMSNTLTSSTLKRQSICINSDSTNGTADSVTCIQDITYILLPPCRKKEKEKLNSGNDRSFIFNPRTTIN